MLADADLGRLLGFRLVRFLLEFAFPLQNLYFLVRLLDVLLRFDIGRLLAEPLTTLEDFNLLLQLLDALLELFD